MRKRELLEIHKRLETIQSEILNVKNYLNQFLTWEEQTILMYEASIGRDQSVVDKLNSEEMKSYAQKCEQYISFGKEADACMADVLDWRTTVRLGGAPAILEKIGCSKKDMYITQKHLRSIVREGATDMTHYHDLDVRQLRQLPELMEEPLAILLSDKKNPDTIVMVLDAKDKNEDQLIVPVNRNGQAVYQGNRLEANFILSVYGKQNIELYLERGAKEQRILFLDNKISTKLGKLPLQLRQFLNKGTYINNIPQTDQNVNGNIGESIGKTTGNKDMLKIEKDIKL